MKNHLSAYLIFAKETKDTTETNLSEFNKDRLAFLKHYHDCFSESLPGTLPP